MSYKYLPDHNKNRETDMTITVIKRNGEKEPLMIEKWQAQIAKVCAGIADVSQSMIEIKAQLHFYDNITTKEIDGITLRAIVDLIDAEHNPVHVQANKMADVIIENGLSKMDEVWAMEQSLYFPGLYSGTTDLVGVYEGQPAICDHKQTNKPKKAEWVEDYYLQLVAYILAHNEVYGTDMKRGVIFMCSRAFEYQQFDLLPENFNKYQDMWLAKVEEYYNAAR